LVEEEEEEEEEEEQEQEEEEEEEEEPRSEGHAKRYSSSRCSRCGKTGWSCGVSQ